MKWIVWGAPVWGKCRTTYFVVVVLHLQCDILFISCAGTGVIVPGSIVFIMDFSSSSSFNKHQKRLILIKHTTIWKMWKVRNEIIFSTKDFRIENLHYICFYGESSLNHVLANALNWSFYFFTFFKHWKVWIVHWKVVFSFQTPSQTHT